MRLYAVRMASFRRTLFVIDGFSHVFRKNQRPKWRRVCLAITGSTLAGFLGYLANTDNVISKKCTKLWRDRVMTVTNTSIVATEAGFSRMSLKAAEPNSAAGSGENDSTGDVFHVREQRFLDFASVLYNGEVYMTPQDFLHSVTQEGARARTYRIAVDDEKVKKWLKATPTRKNGSSKFFRQLNERGLISYVEYLFLLCILTEPKSGFEIAFNMFDIDGNKKVDIYEFNVLTKLFSHKVNKKKFAPSDVVGPDDLPKAVNTLPLSETEKLKDTQTTTLLQHLFGVAGKEDLSYEAFVKFTENLQEEVLDMEFQQYAKGLTTISEVDFAKILLRYTNLSEASTEEYIDRVRMRIMDSKGVTFSEFKNFFLFLNHLDDFVLMMRLYNISDHPISKEEFRRAVHICGGEEISEPLIDAVYMIFDTDGDGHLSTEEFISIMKSRLKRGLRAHLVKDQTGWPKFVGCVKHEMRTHRAGM